MTTVLIAFAAGGLAAIAVGVWRAVRRLEREIGDVIPELPAEEVPRG